MRKEAETAAEFVIAFFVFAAAGKSENNVSLSARPGIVGGRKHRGQNFPARSERGRMNRVREQNS